MKQIKFSHWYFKLASVYSRNGDKKARLLQVLKIQYNELTEDLIKYDVTYGDMESYPLPKTDLILLVFNAYNSKGGLFTTIRRYTPNKFVYYKKAQGEIFEVVVDE